LLGLAAFSTGRALILQPRVVVILELEDVVGRVGQENRPVLLGGSPWLSIRSVNAPVGRPVSMTIVVPCWPGCIWYLLGVRSYCGYQ